jgi:hypothetical protein
MSALRSMSRARCLRRTAQNEGVVLGLQPPSAAPTCRSSGPEAGTATAACFWRSDARIHLDGEGPLRTGAQASLIEHPIEASRAERIP